MSAILRFCNSQYFEYVFIWLNISGSENLGSGEADYLTEKHFSLTKHDFPWSRAAGCVWQHSHLSV